jgi:hypothetical protein
MSAGRRRAQDSMSTTAARRPSIHDIDDRESRRRARFSDLAMIAPTPELIRAVMALEAEADGTLEPSGYVVIDIEPAGEPVPAET